ncbi:FtsX-like permease family protein [Bacteroidales bacterium OttesenSCG-928-B11]|nr:FtsX-like permease family protein [Bacteroidales bacterium OttesenSCG-928-B11]MDL2326884.1 FtsX-like permease family protein [Bacteroidales bacterium OttesenSCG-928-A14]
MTLRTAFKNILGAGKRTWLIVFVLSFTMVIMVGFNGLIDGWVEESKIESVNWQMGDGQFWHPQYDRYDIFSLQDAHGKYPEELAPYVENKSITPILLTQATIYPQGRMQNVILNGIDMEQSVLEIPSSLLKNDDQTDIPVIIGERMANAADLKEGDRVMLRWRDKNGAFDAKEVIVAGIFTNKVPATDAGQIWLNIHDLYEMTGMSNEATYFVKSQECPLEQDAGEWIFRDLDYLLADINEMEQSANVESAIVFILLLSISLLAVFDTQTLSIFRRQKEIGTYIALGMTPKKVIGLFTLEGTCYSILAVFAGIIWGTPLLILFQKYGFSIPESTQDMGVVMGDAMYPAYHLSSITISILIIIVLSAIISYIPTRKIAKQNVVHALKGKVQ